MGHGTKMKKGLECDRSGGGLGSMPHFPLPNGLLRLTHLPFLATREKTGSSVKSQIVRRRRMRNCIVGS